jgi:hypothetical protein
MGYLYDQPVMAAFGLDSGPEAPNWRPSGACNAYDPDWWTSTDRTELGAAVWVCQHRCPVAVAQQCLEWARGHRELVDQAVYGGVFWTRGGKDEKRVDTTPRPSRNPPVPVDPARTALPTKRPEVGYRRPAGVLTDKNPCGTVNGYHRHKRAREVPCAECLSVINAHLRERFGTQPLSTDTQALSTDALESGTGEAAA